MKIKKTQQNPTNSTKRNKTQQNSVKLDKATKKLDEI